MILIPMNMNDNVDLATLRHSTSHLMAQAVKKLFPEAKLAIGPSIDTGFYYDFDIERNFTPEDLSRIEDKMRELVKMDSDFVKNEVKSEEAIEFFEKLNEPYKVELIRDLNQPTVTIYKHSDFSDLCAGPHLKSTRDIGAFKLLNVAGAYWRGDVRNKMLQRIYGTAFRTQKELDEYRELLKETERRDHRKIGRDLDLYSFHDEGPGFAFFHPKGIVVINEILKYWRHKHEEQGYLEVKTPIILNNELWVQSGHWEHYRENMYFTRIDDIDYAVKPMNCPGVVLIYKSRQHSYREFPLKIAELGLVHRHELSGVLHGLFRVRAFTQDDAHIFCLPEQVKSEVIDVIRLIFDMYETFGFSDFMLELSTRPEHSIGTDEMWKGAQDALSEALSSEGVDFRINEGAGAFYGPKIDFHIRDCMGRTWQCGTIQVDFAMPDRFDLEYAGRDNLRHRPVMIHRTVLGSIERFLGILIEHYAGAFPLWLAPVQLRVLTINENVIEYARSLKEEFSGEGFRVEIDERPESIGRKIRESQLEKVPYMLIVGDKEMESSTISVRDRSGREERGLKIGTFINRVRSEQKERF
jgi:threonyl-tRNA synthetase